MVCMWNSEHALRMLAPGGIYISPWDLSFFSFPSTYSVGTPCGCRCLNPPKACSVYVLRPITRVTGKIPIGRENDGCICILSSYVYVLIRPCKLCFDVGVIYFSTLRFPLSCSSFENRNKEKLRQEKKTI